MAGAQDEDPVSWHWIFVRRSVCLCGLLGVIGIVLLGPHPPSTLAFKGARRLKDASDSKCEGTQQEVRACGNTPCVVVSSPVACVWGDWTDWGACSCAGSQSRHREIVQASAFGGKACEGPEQQAQPCATTCPQKMKVDCKFAPWSAFSACTRSCEGGQQYRTREIAKQAQNGGAFCNGQLHGVQVCNEQDCPGRQTVDCKMGSWDVWSACTVTCGGGQKRRTRQVKVSAQNGGKLCDAGNLVEIAKCGSVACKGGRVDCWWSAWSRWSQCSQTCGGGQLFRVRSITVEASNGGAGCEGNFEDYKPCATQPCVARGVDCVFNDWSSWSVCSSPCNGYHSKSRSIAVMAKNGGKPCEGSTMATFPCNVQATACRDQDVDCLFSPWGAWSVCSVTCSGGTTSRTRRVEVHARGFGKPCEGNMEEVRQCHPEPCLGEEPTDCQWGPWSSWSACTEPCGGGEHRRHRTIIMEPKHGGKPCVSGGSIDVGACNTDPCVEEVLLCEWATWSEWSQCNRGGALVTCGSGQQRRTRMTQLVEEKIAKGAVSSKSVEGRRLDVSQSLAIYTPGLKFAWDASNDSKSVEGRRQDVSQSLVTSTPGLKFSWDASNDNSSVRSDVSYAPRRLSVRKLAQSCKVMQQELQPCAQAPCDQPTPRDCIWDMWSEWAACPCNGVTERHRVIASYLIAGGKPCDGPEVQAKPCIPDCKIIPALDCDFSDWTEWSGCPVTCGTGDSKGEVLRYRTVVRYPQGKGQQCVGPRKQTRPCDVKPCPMSLDCRWDLWTSFSACSVSCGGGQKSRTRNIVQIAKNGGMPCDQADSMQVAPCGTKPCPSNYRDCQFTAWQPWEACSITCGGGKQHRTRGISVEATEGGNPCSGLLQEFRSCGMKNCEDRPTIPCAWGPWSLWSSCSALCNGHQERNRAIAQFASNGGKPCSGSEREIGACNLHVPACAADEASDCQISPWNSWTPCSAKCDGGQQYRSRTIQKPARNAGKPCSGPLQQAQACNVDLCPGSTRVDCQWSQWDEWSACSVSCGGGQRTKQRGIQVEPANAGRSCDARDAMVVGICNAGTCQDMLEVCAWTEWGEWDLCTQTCGGGQQQRMRQKQFLPNPRLAKQQPSLARRLDASNSSQLAMRRLQQTATGAKATNAYQACTGSQKQIRPCGITPCADTPKPIPCGWGDWSAWGSCSCNGLQEHERSIAVSAKNGGPVCEGAARETRRCVPHCEQPSKDCVFSPWSDWSRCSMKCGGGQQFHTRTVAIHAAKFGKGCIGGLEETKTCNTQQCHAPVDCAYTVFSDWSACSVSCGGGQKARSRGIAVNAKYGGKPCVSADLMVIASCNTQSCSPWAPVDCKFGTWSDWSDCSVTCGTGQQYHTHKIVTKAAHGGKPCDGRYEEYQSCKLTDCSSQAVDCKFTAWSDWGDCTTVCGGHRDRARSIARFAAKGGQPCEGGTRQTQPCNSDPVKCGPAGGNADCMLSSWGPWSDCSQSCNGGQRFSTRMVAQQARGAGQPCSGSLKLTKSCNVQPCPGQEPVDCKFADWEAFQDCSATCGGGQTHRHRAIRIEAKNGGKPCPQGDSIQVTSCNTQPCSATQFCVWSDWTPFNECSSTCDGGQKKRRRSLVMTSQLPRGTTPVLAAWQADQGPRGAFQNFTVRYGLHLCFLAIVGAMTLLFVAGSAAIKAVRRLRHDPEQYAMLPDFEQPGIADAGAQAYHPVPMHDSQSLGPAMYPWAAADDVAE